jgi:hypothetical protein
MPRARLDVSSEIIADVRMMLASKGVAILKEEPLPFNEGVRLTIEGPSLPVAEHDGEPLVVAYCIKDGVSARIERFERV